MGGELGSENGGNGRPPAIAMVLDTGSYLYKYAPAPEMTAYDVGCAVAFFQLLNMMRFDGALPPAIDAQLAEVYKAIPNSTRAYLAQARKVAPSLVLPPGARGR